jgi:hypothetical protein
MSNKFLSILFFCLSILLVACNGDTGLLYASECSAVSKSKFTNSIFKNNSSYALYNEGMIYRNDGSNKIVGSAFFDTIMDKKDDVLIAGGALDNSAGNFCISPQNNGLGSGLITYSLKPTPGDIHIIATFTLSDCHFTKISGNTYKFHAAFAVTKNPDPNPEAVVFDQYVNNSGTVEFTCERK